MIAFFDSSILIWRVEGAAAFRDAAQDALARLTALHPELQFAASRLARLECRAKPLRDGDHALLVQYERAFAHDLQVFEISAMVVEQATILRAEQGLKTADAIHAATALLAAPAILVTGDAVFERVPGLEVCLVKPAAPKRRSSR